MNQEWALRRPSIDTADALLIAERWFGVSGQAAELGSQQDRNFLITDDGGTRWLLKISNSAFADDEIDAQNAVMRRLGEHGLNVPEPMPTSAGVLRAPIELDGVLHAARLLTWVEGSPLIERTRLTDEVVASVGELAGDVSAALAGMNHPGLLRSLQWDLRRAGEVVHALAGHIPDPARRAQVEAATAEALRVVGTVASELPVQAVHGDLTDDNIVVDRDGRVGGIIDFGDASESWRVSELVIACSFVLHHDPIRPLAILPLVAAFDRRVRLTDAEIEAIWPLLVLRGATLVVSGLQQVAIDPANEYARNALEREWSMFEAAAAQEWQVMTAALRSAVRSDVPAPTPWHGALPFIRDAGTIHDVSLGYDSRTLDGGIWLGDADAVEDALLHAAAGDGIAVTRFAEPRLTRAGPPSGEEPANAPVFIDVASGSAIEIVAPVSGRVHVDGSIVTLVADGLALVVEGRRRGDVPCGEVEAGARIGSFDGRIRVWYLSAHRAEAPLALPRFVRPSERAAWRSLFLDPASILVPSGQSHASADVEVELERRERAYAPLQGHYYARPPQIERGWREYLIDTNGRHYLDMVNNVAVLGHGHPRLAEAVADQWRMLNTNSRFHYRSVVEFSERLLQTVPSPLDTVLLVNSGTEAVDLALRLARAHTGRQEVACVTESYHGWSVAADAVSTSTSDNPLVEQTRPSWVRVLEAPNAYRGRYRGANAGVQYAGDAVGQVRAWAAEGAPVGAFIAEPRHGNAGAIEVPAGYLAAVYEAVRACGGVCIADEVQVGYGRQGDVFWGFEQHPGVVPDIITAAKAMGNGHPLGVVITRSDIARSLEAQGTFFSSAGGSTLSAKLGTTVLDIMRDEKLQEHALEMGQRLLAGFAALAERHDLIGAAHGRGLYLGLELVRDRTTLEPATSETRELCDRLLQRGVIVQPTGDRQNVLKIKPPLCVSPESVDYFLEALDTVLTEEI